MADPHLIPTAVTIVAVLLGIFLSNQRLNTMELRIDARINALDTRFDVLLSKVIDVDNRLTRIEERLTK
jgi:predicted component of type VI protein secretion system